TTPLSSRRASRTFVLPWHNGSVQPQESEKGKGGRFTIHIPKSLNQMTSGAGSSTSLLGY
ncbi:MAG TPA: hypothetical protein PKH07_11595, partial [bacterium]|nr:hypothetical protein [bacterium]